MRGLLLLLATVLSGLERILELMVTAYDVIVYGPLQKSLSPLVAKVPRKLAFVGQSYDIFTANNVTFSRTLLVVPIGLCLKYGYGFSACGLVVWHDFLDHLDGIVAKTQKKVYGGHIDDPLLGGYLDAICDKVVFVFVMAAIYMVAPLHRMTTVQSAVFVGISSTLVAYEVVLGTVRTTDYFTAHFHRQYYGNVPSTSGIAASMAGKLKEKLIAISEALLCVAVVTENPMTSRAGVVAMVTLLLSIWFAHKSLQHKLYMRKLSGVENNNHNGRTPTTAHSTHNTNLNNRVAVHGNGLVHKQQQQQQQQHRQCIVRNHDHNHQHDRDCNHDHHHHQQQHQEEIQEEEEQVDRVYTVGCFDMLHRGHINILTQMRQLGKQVIVGVHSSESMQLLKNLTPTDSLETRMTNVKQYADQVFAVWGTDPSPYIKCAFHVQPGETAMFVRGNDMPNFPGRSVCEEVMLIRLLPYTEGVSSTLLRAQMRAASCSF